MAVNTEKLIGALIPKNTVIAKAKSNVRIQLLIAASLVLKPMISRIPITASAIEAMLPIMFTAGLSKKGIMVAV